MFQAYHTEQDVDIAEMGEELYLLKVPKYVAELWHAADQDMELGKLFEISEQTAGKNTTTNNNNQNTTEWQSDNPFAKMDNKNSSIKIRLNPALQSKMTAEMSHQDKTSIFNEHEITICNEESLGQPHPTTSSSSSSSQRVDDAKSQRLFVVQETRSSTMSGSNTIGGGGVGGASGSLANTRPSYRLLGRVGRRLNLQPQRSSHAYMRMKKRQIRAINDDCQKAELISTHHVGFIPKSSHAHNQTVHSSGGGGGGGGRGGGGDGDSGGAHSSFDNAKSIRLDKEEVINLVCKAFEDHQYYSIKNLQDITKQPFALLKEVLTEIAKYNTAPPHRCLWELKPEYRFYSSSSSNK